MKWIKGVTLVPWLVASGGYWLARGASWVVLLAGYLLMGLGFMFLIILGPFMIAGSGAARLHDGGLNGWVALGVFIIAFVLLVVLGLSLTVGMMGGVQDVFLPIINDKADPEYEKTTPREFRDDLTPWG